MLIGIHGKARSGKDTVATRLAGEIGLFEILHYADAVKDVCRTLFRFSERQLYGDQKEVVDPRWGFTPRYGMQRIGDGFREWFGSDFWIKKLDEQIRVSKHQVIADVRYPNEVAHIRNRGGFIVKIERPNSGEITGIPNHASEVSLDGFTDWDYIILNQRALSDLYAEVDKMMEDLTTRTR